MSERSRRKERQAKRAAARAPASPPLPSRPASVPSQRGTFRVAAAQRQIAADLPDVIYQRRSPNNARQKRLDNSVVQAPIVNAPSDVKKTIASARRAPGVDLREQPIDEPGKCRPKDNTPKGSGGSGRSFHLWKKTC